ncbi:MAG: cytochrome c3 family protein [Bryobacterales bacterium]|nr:cytochrome c3 family protein [Bryobacteraceae bacterium]MDW8354415.1 cytochrome c3 family protein [Bryobacterales bacterium]
MKLRFAAVLVPLGLPPPAEAKDSCWECHAVLEGPLQRPAALYKADVHARHGFGCAACHGGDPSSDDPHLSMSPRRGFRGKISRAAIAKLCAHCHSDASLMHKYNPRQRVDQYAQYLTSVHGQRIAQGDTAAATCIDCHSVHDIRNVKDARAPVHPLRLPDTCARCHADPGYMAKYGIPTDQFDKYRRSVHWQALAERGDLSAPSCASCHGNHGATPPGVSSVAAVCGTCHVLLEELFNKSPHQPVFASMGMAGCIVCHGNHEVLKPSPAMLAGPKSVCAQCHDPDSSGAIAGAEMARLINDLRASLDRARAMLERAASSGMEVSEAQIRQQEAEEAWIKARVAVHAFRIEAVREPVETGLKLAAETYRAGVAALEERNRRRIGLAVSLVTIAVTMAGLWMAIRAIERSQGSS